MELKESNVLFFEDTHTYLLGSTDLRGITDTLIKAVFGDYTRNIPRDVLETAAARGTDIHKELARIDAGQSFPSAYEECEYVRLRDGLGLIPVRSEYIVTDGKYFASPIDKVYEGDIIADVKTTSKVHWGEVSLQLSWYAAMYKVMNGRSVQRAYVFHLPKERYGGCGVYYVTLVAESVIADLVAHYLAGDDVSEYASLFECTSIKDVPSAVSAALDAVRRQTETIADLEGRLKTLRAAREEEVRVVADYLSSAREKKIVAGRVSVTYVPSSVRVGLDVESLRRDHPDIYERYKTETAVRDSVRISIRNKNK